MPSKFKKNKRRMRKVQAQRRALEEQNAANPPVKASPAISVNALCAAAKKKVIETPKPAPEQIPQSIPAAVPVEETPEIELKPVVTEPVPVKVEAPVAVLENTPAELEVVQEAPATVPEEAPAVEAPPAEPTVVQAETAKEAEPIIPETEPEAEVKPPADVPVEPVAEPEDAVVQSVEVAEVPVTIPVVPVEEAKDHLIEVQEPPATQNVADSVVDDFVVTESASVVEVAIAESAAVQPEVVEVSNTPNIQSDSMDVMPAMHDPAAVPSEEMVIEAIAEQTCMDMLSEEPKSEICDMPCQMQHAVECVEMSVEATLNGHMVPEVSIES